MRAKGEEYPLAAEVNWMFGTSDPRRIGGYSLLRQVRFLWEAAEDQLEEDYCG